MLKDITNDPDRGNYLSRVQRGVIVMLEGSSKELIVLKRTGGTLYVQQHDGDKIKSRASARRQNDWETEHDHQRGDKRKVNEVTHVRVSGRKRRRRYY